MEFSVSKANFANFDSQVEGKPQRVDLAVSDLRGFLEDDTSQERFRQRRHEAFFEVKWLGRGWRGHTFEMDARKRVKGVATDVEKLSRHLEMGRCSVAGMLVIDDEDYFTEHEANLGIEWPANVWRLVLGPSLLTRYGLLDHDLIGVVA